MTIFVTITFKTIGICYKLEAFLVQCLLITAEIQAPGYFLYFGKIIFDDINVGRLKLFVLVLYVTFATLFGFTIGITNCYVTNKILRLGRSIHRLYNRTLRKESYVKMETFCLSVQVLEEIPENFVWSNVRFRPKEFLSVNEISTILRIIC